MDEEKRRLLKKEAVRYMELMQIDNEKVNDFKDKEKLTVVYINHIEKKYRYDEMTEQEEKMVREFEKERDAIVYYVIHSVSQWEDDGSSLTLYTLLYMDDILYNDPDNMEKCITEFSTVMAYVINVEVPVYSALGEVGFVNVNGAILAG